MTEHSTTLVSPTPARRAATARQPQKEKSSNNNPVDATALRKTFSKLKGNEVVYTRGRQLFFCTADRFKTENFSWTGLQKITIVQLRIFITIHMSYYNFDSMRTLSLFFRNETLPPRNYGTQ